MMALPHETIQLQNGCQATPIRGNYKGGNPRSLLSPGGEAASPYASGTLRLQG